MNRFPLRHILYVEDNPNIRTLAKISLERIGGFSLHSCESGAQALAAVEAGLQPDLLLLDVMLPGMDGPTILEHLRRLPQTAATPVIFMTAKAQSSEIAHFMSLGALGVITKPFQPTQLPADIRHLWNKQPAATSVHDDLDDALEEFRKRFLSALPKQIDDLKAFAAQLGTPDAATCLPELHNLLHVLSGSAGTFGFDELGHRARAVETPLRKSMDAGSGAALPPIADELKEFLRWYDTRFAAGVPAPAAASQASVASAVSAPPAAPTAAATLPPRRSGSSGNRLVYVAGTPAVDDDLANQLVHFGYEVKGIAHAGGLAAALHERMPCAIVVDADTRDGILAACAEAAAARSGNATAACPLIVVSSHGEFATRLAAARHGVQAYLLKPFDAAELTELLAEPAGAGQPYRILIVDDDETTALHYKAILNSARIEASILTKPENIFRTLEKYRPELIVMDLYMPGCSGADLAALIRQDKTFLDVPIVFLSNEHNLDRQAEAIQSGADYFLTKPITPERLVSALSSRAERYRSLRGLIMCDGLTGLYNHTAIKEHLQREILRARRSQLQLSVAMIDLDHFKKINDTWGHPVGDQVIRSLARLMQQRFRRSDWVGRYGGEEFLVILPSTSTAPAFGVLDDVRQAFSKIRHHAGEMEFTATLSAGIAELADSDDCDRLIQAADAMLYRAKERGRNCVEAK